MSFKTVYQNLLEIFPQVDVRILKAVAIEHPKDSDAAVEFILYEVLPPLDGNCEPLHTHHDNHDVASEVRTRDQGLKLDSQVVGAVQLESTGLPTGFSDNSVSLMSCYAEEFETYIVNGETNNQCSSLLLAENHRDLIGYGDVMKGVDSSIKECEEEFLWLQSVDTAAADLKSSHGASSSVSTIMLSGDCTVEAQKNLSNASAENQERQSRFLPDISELLACSIERIALEEKDLPRTPATPLVYADPLENCIVDADNMSPHVSKNIMDIGEHSAEVPKDAGITSGEDEAHHSGSLDGNSSDLFLCSSETVPFEESDISILSSRSGFSVNMDVLDGYVTNAKNNKKSLVSSVESVVNMMKEVDALEEMAKQAKEDASSAGQATLTKVVGLKQMLERAKQANDMHAGEVYGEKAILSTEARELQSRLLSLSDERDISSSIIEEVQRTLEARIAAAENEIAESEQEKLQKEQSAQMALKEQEANMEAMVQESRRLQQEAEENAKLRDFLMDRGSVVDALQGEMAVILEDVMFLKERVDGRLPLGGSLMANYSSASSPASSLSLKSKSLTDSDVQILESSDSLSIKSKSLADSDVQILQSSKLFRENIDDLSRRQEQAVRIANGGNKLALSDEQKQNSDDDWELFERQDWPF